MLTLDLVTRALPANLKHAATQDLVDRINAATGDPIVAEQIRENFISYASVLKDGRFKTDDYLNAVKYVSFKLMGDSNQDAYFKTFPSRYQNLLANNATPKDLASYASMYNKGKLVNLILEQSMVPTHVLNAHVFQQAVNSQVALMTDPNVSAKVRSDAANSLLTHLKKPEAKAELNIDLRENSGLTELKSMLQRLAQTQRDAIQSGVPTHEIASQALIEGKAEEVQ